MASNVYEIVTARIIERIEKDGVLPWRKPWKSYLSHDGAPQNLVSKKPYRGSNVWMLMMGGYSSPFFVTFKQAKELGGSVRKGEKGWPVVYWIWFKKENKTTGEKEQIPVLKYYTVFNLQQCEGIEIPKLEAKKLNTLESIEACDRIVANMPSAPRIEHKEAQAYYSPSADRVNMPLKASFVSAHAYYHTLFHELTHATGHESRLGRLKGTALLARYGSEPYAKEELVAELGASYVSGIAGIQATQEDQTVAYIQGWLSALKKDPKLLIHASAQAQKAADFILGIEREEATKE